jgi:hypothetical protein
MKNYSINLILWCLFIWTISFAQQTPQSPIPTSLSQNCLLTQSGTIDFCPTYRNQVRDLNLKLAQLRQRSEDRWAITLLETIETRLKSLRGQSNILLQKTLTGYPLFISEYESYITESIYTYIKQNPNDKNIVRSFFQNTYFDQDQSGLGISEIKLYKWSPRQYDTSLLLQVSIRNYTNNPLANIEDLYCFSTINDQDYIYPIGIKTSFKENTITNLIINLKPGISPLLEQAGDKKIACILVYSQISKIKYTNRSSLIFQIKN